MKVYIFSQLSICQMGNRVRNLDVFAYAWHPLRSWNVCPIIKMSFQILLIHIVNYNQNSFRSPFQFGQLQIQFQFSWSSLICVWSDSSYGKMEKTAVREAIKEWCSSSGYENAQLHLQASMKWKIDSNWVLHVKTHGQEKFSQRFSYKRQGVIVSTDFVHIDNTNHVLIETDNAMVVLLNNLMDEMKTAPCIINKLPYEFDCMEFSKKWVSRIMFWPLHILLNFLN